MNQEKISKAISDFVEANDEYTRLVNEIIVTSRKICPDEYTVMLGAFVRQKKALDYLRESLFELVSERCDANEARTAMHLVGDIWSARDELINLALCAREVVDAQIESDNENAKAIDARLLAKLDQVLTSSQAKLWKLEKYKA